MMIDRGGNQSQLELPKLCERYGHAIGEDGGYLRRRKRRERKRAGT
jgi:hypothetical protein